ncbi:hypothetical protein [Geomonas sp.]|uniref:CopG family ribbon-helix-helix protein n=1 Tax=Geomonas sp. TaxID=2651584 RepID=UPI002B4808C6|nr:hypothetical protein [Geomonas sp.]HJV35181.1 hypothetical protein [Geomonas sp.]
MQSEIKAVSVNLPEGDRNRLERLGELKKQPLDTLMQDAVRQYLDREEATERFRQETVAAWNEYENSKASASQEDVAAWLATWGTDDETDCPICRK